MRKMTSSPKGEGRHLGVLVLDGVIALLLLALDQFTKHLAVVYLKGRTPFVAIKGVLEFQYLENRGSAFSLFEDQKLFILTVGVLAVGAILALMVRVPGGKRFRIVHVLLAVLAAGALGNIVDRVRFGYVVDFISVVFLHFPIFNAADCYIVVCTFVLFYLFVFHFEEEELGFLDFRRKRERH